MNLQQRLCAFAFAGAMASTVAFGSAQVYQSPPPGNMHNGERGTCASSRNLVHVHRRLAGVINQLSHDQHDYAGHKAKAAEDLEAARQELSSAEQYAVSVDHDNPSCFQTSGGTGGYRPNPGQGNYQGNPGYQGNPNNGERAQNPSNQNVVLMSTRIERLIDELQRDQRDYGGHRVAAITDMQNARNEMLQAEQAAGARPGITPGNPPR